MKKLLEYIVSGIVSNPKSVLVEEREENGMMILSFSVDPLDMGKVIGKGGKIIKSIRNVVRILAIKEGKRVNVELQEAPIS